MGRRKQRLERHHRYNADRSGRVYTKFGLSLREYDVAKACIRFFIELHAQGRSGAKIDEVAAKIGPLLGISPQTAKTHLENVLARVRCGKLSRLGQKIKLPDEA